MNTAFPDLRGKQWAKAVPPVPHGLMAEVDAVLELNRAGFGGGHFV